MSLPACPTEAHEGTVPGTVPGWFRNRWNPSRNERVVYCADCAELGEMAGVFTPDPNEDDTVITRTDKYNISIDGLTVRADTDQEQRIRALDAEQLAAFTRIMGKS